MYIVNLYNIRWKRKYSQEEIAKETGLSKNTVNQLFSGKYHNHKLKTLEIIAKFFECKINDILVEVEDDK